MTFNDLVTKVREKVCGANLSGVPFIAIQVNITGKESGVFYIEIKDGKGSVEPYDYHDRSCAFTVDMANFNKIVDGKLDPVAAYTTGKLKVDGDLGKALEFSNLLKQAGKKK